MSLFQSESCSEERTEESYDDKTTKRPSTKTTGTTRPLTTVKKTTFRGGSVSRTTKKSDDTYEDTYEEIIDYTSKIPLTRSKLKFYVVRIAT